MSLREGERQALGTAVLASILLHVLLLNALPGWREAQTTSAAAPILARVVADLAPAVRPGEVRKSSPTQKTSAPAAKKAAPRPIEPAPEQALAQKAPAPTAVSAAPVNETPGVATGSPLAPAAAAPASPEAASLPAADGATLAQYRLAVISLAKGFNRYPRIAIENNWQGRVEVRVRVGADGAIASLGLHPGSGHEILDRQALDMIGRAASQVPLPASLRGRELVIDIPVIFSLRDAER
ncbi:MAG: energy transducer TonB [Betaproteobacteria bacterium]|nr:MAG: energy transducer TonB [Betaproteobacteria bacterium]